MNKSNEPRREKTLIEKIINIVMVIVFGGAFILTLIFGVKSYLESTSGNLNLVKVENAFVDVNGDGLLDFVPYAEVVINTGNNLQSLIPSP